MNAKIERPCILIVDDYPDRNHRAIIAGLGDSAEILVLHPEEIDTSNVLTSDLVLVDYKLEFWPERDTLGCISLKPKTGMSLAVILREYVDDVGDTGHITAFALHTALLGSVRGRLPSLTAQHLIARLNNLEWVFPKNYRRRFEQILILANAIQEIQFIWPENEDDSSVTLKKVLALQEKKAWANRCWREVRDCYSPVYELSSGTHQIQLVRWLLHQVMPYPCFLWDKYWVAARLQISVKEFCRVVKGECELAKDLNSMRYSGLLSGFLGERWWRGAVEDYVWKISNPPNSTKKLNNALNERTSVILNSIEANPAIVCLDQSLLPKEKFSSPADAVRLQPDHWPAFADPAWMKIQDIEDDPALMAIVNPLDLAKIENDHRE